MTHAISPALQQLQADAARALSYHGPDPRPWVATRPGVDEQVVIVGAGHSGLSIGLALRRAGIPALLIDAAAEHCGGIWRGKARMHVLRTAKVLAGPEVELQALGFRHWYEVQHGAEAYAALGTIPREAWADYLDWFRAAVDLPIRWQTTLLGVVPREDGSLVLQLDQGGRPETLVTRKLVLATGIVGSGEPALPPFLAGLAGPAGPVFHADQPIDFAQFRGRRVAVLGAAASAFDAAAVALEAGAAEVGLSSRRPELVRGSGAKVLGYPGAQEHFFDLPDARRWELIRRVRDYGGGAPWSSLERVAQQPGFRLHLGESWERVERTGDGRLRVRTSTGREAVYDAVIAATGYRVDLSRRPELEVLQGQIRRWADQVGPELAAEDEELGRFPYLGAGFQFLERQPGALPALANVHCFNYGAFASFGRLIGDVPSLRLGVPRLVSHIVRDFFLADPEAQWARLTAPVPEDFSREDYERLLARALG